MSHAFTVVLCLMAVGCNRANSPASQIEQVLQADKQLFKKASTEVSSGTSRRLAFGNAVTKMRTIDTSGCPTDFRTAYLRHCHAWEAAQQWLETQPENFLEAFVSGFLQGLSGQELDLSDSEARKHQESIRKTFEEVEVIAIRYGAKTN